jgi:hypothetical protein
MRKASLALALVLLVSTFAFAASTFDSQARTKWVKLYSEPQVQVLVKDIKEAIFNLHYDKNTSFKNDADEFLTMLALLSENGVSYMGVRQVVLNYAFGSAKIEPLLLNSKIKVLAQIKKGPALIKDVLDIQTGAIK